MPINSSSRITSFPFRASITSFCRYCRISFCFACSNCRNSSCERFFTLTSAFLFSVGLPRTVRVDSQNAFVVMRCSSRPCSGKLHVNLVLVDIVGFLATFRTCCPDCIGVVSTVCDNTVSPLGRATLHDELVCNSNFLLTCRLSCPRHLHGLRLVDHPLASLHVVLCAATHPNLRGSTAISVLVPCSPIVVPGHSKTSIAQVHI